MTSFFMGNEPYYQGAVNNAWQYFKRKSPTVLYPQGLGGDGFGKRPRNFESLKRESKTLDQV